MEPTTVPLRNPIVEPAQRRLRFIGVALAAVACIVVAAASISCDASDEASPTREPEPPTATVAAPQPEPSATPTVESRLPTPPARVAVPGHDPVTPFTNVTRAAFGPNAFVNNWHPGTAFFDFDRDGDIDIYVTQANADSELPEAPGGPNLLFRNDGDFVFTEVAVSLGADASLSNSSAVAACDFDNDGYQDLYVAGYGLIGDDLDYRSATDNPALIAATKDRLLRNVEGEAFADVTDAAFGDAINLRAAISVSCADVDTDGDLDVFVGNRLDQDFIRFDDPRHHGHYNVLYRNDGDMRFTDITESAGLIGPPIKMLSPDGEPVLYDHPGRAEPVPGFDASLLDAGGNMIGEPTGQTLASMFFDHDDDSDLDLWLADDGDTLKVYRNDSTASQIRFTSIESAMGIDSVGAWMGFATGDYDQDQDLDVFVTNIGYHFLLHDVPPVPSGDCAYSHRYGWGTCYHFLLRNDGVEQHATAGTIGKFVNVAPQTDVEPSRAMPPESLDRSTILPEWGDAPTGLAAYDFGFGTVFFDYENDGDQDLYWLGAMGGRGEGPNGLKYKGSGRMLRADGRGAFEDITVESRLLDIQGVDYTTIDPVSAQFDPQRQRMSNEFHENGKGLAKCDLNADGAVDLLGTNSNGPVYISDRAVDFFRGPLFLWMNNAKDGNWLTLRLIGRQAIDGSGSNADAIGARVTLTAVDGRAGGNPLTQVQDVGGGSTFLSMNCLDLHFGVNGADIVDQIDIRWPSGTLQTLHDVKVNQRLDVVEPTR